MEVYKYEKSGWILDPEGNKIEFGEPIDTDQIAIGFEKMGGETNTFT